VWRAAAGGAVVTDVGSTKAGIARVADRLTAGRALAFVGSHPMAGSERSGYGVARADLFRSATVVVTPTDRTEPHAVKAVAGFWEALGARVSALDPETHDQAVAAISHLPHLVAYALVDGAARFGPTALELAARGFKDTTRIAASDPDVWAEIFLANRAALAAVGALGADVTRKGPGHYRVAGAGRHGLHESDDVIDCGNSGTTARLLLGVLAGQPFCTLLTGDASLRRRPMARVTEPLGRMGATIVGRAQATRLPLAVQGARPLRAIAHTSPVASAQVKSAVLLAGLYADGPVSVHEPAPSRDHSERMLRRFGARLRAE